MGIIHNIQKIRATSISKLFKIVLFRVLQNCLIVAERKRCPPVFSFKIKEDIHSIIISNYEKMIVSPNEIEKCAGRIIDNRIFLFNTEFQIPNNAWLQDPISKKYWDPNVFFSDAKVEEDGLGDVKYVMELNKMYHLVTLAQAYYECHQGVYIIKIGELLNSWKETVKYEKSVVNKSMLDIIYRCFNLIHILLLCYDNQYFRDKILPVVLEILFFSERQIRLFSTPRWCKYSTGANHTIGEMSGIIAIQQLLQHLTDQNYDSYLKTEYKYLYNSLKNIITEEGVYLEQSANYAKLVAEFLMMLDMIVLAIGSENCRSLYDDKYLKRLLVYVNTLSYNHILPNFGDNDGAKATTPFYKSKNSVLHLNKYLALRYPDVLAKNNITCLESGQFIWKSNDEEGVYFFTRVGRHSFLPLGSGSHAHNDQLAVWIGNKGYDIFIDYGTYLYNSGIDIINRDRATKQHNTLSVDNIEQAEFAGKWLYGSYPDGHILKASVSSEGFEFEGDCKYDKVVHNRQVVYSGHQMTITDNVSCLFDSTISLTFVLAPYLRIERDGQKVQIFKGSILMATVICPDFVIINSENIDFHPSYGEKQKTTKLTFRSIIKGSQTIKTQILL